MSKSILIAGTDPVFTSIEKELKGKGHSVERVNFAGEIVRKIKEDKPDLIISALTLKNSDIFHLSYKLRALPAKFFTPVLAVDDIKKQAVAGAADKAGIFLYCENSDINKLKSKINYALKFSDEVKDKKIEKYPSIKIVSDIQKKILEEISSEKLGKAESSLEKGEISRAIEICTFLQIINPSMQAARMLRLSLEAARNRSGEIKDRTPEGKLENPDKITLEARTLISKNDIEGAANLCRQLFRGEEVKRGIKILNSLSTEGRYSFSTVKCPTCKTENPVENDYCDDCGLYLGSAKKGGITTDIEKKKKELRTLTTEDERKNILGYIALASVLASYFVHIRFFAGLGIILGIFAFTGGSKKPGGIAAGIGLILFLMSFAGLQPASNYIRGVAGRVERVTPYSFDIEPEEITPAIGESVVSYELTEPARASIQIMHSDRRVVGYHFHNQERGAGLHTETFDGTVNGNPLAQGDYYLRLLVKQEDRPPRTAFISFEIK